MAHSGALVHFIFTQIPLFADSSALMLFISAQIPLLADSGALMLFIFAQIPLLTDSGALVLFISAHRPLSAGTNALPNIQPASFSPHQFGFIPLISSSSPLSAAPMGFIPFTFSPFSSFYICTLTLHLRLPFTLPSPLPPLLHNAKKAPPTAALCRLEGLSVIIRLLWQKRLIAYLFRLAPCRQARAVIP